MNTRKIEYQNYITQDKGISLFCSVFFLVRVSLDLEEQPSTNGERETSFPVSLLLQICAHSFAKALQSERRRFAVVV